MRTLEATRPLGLPHVLGARPYFEVIWVRAEPVVTGMHDVETRWDRATEVLVDHAVNLRRSEPTAELNHAVPVAGRPRPFPAPVSLNESSERANGSALALALLRLWRWLAWPGMRNVRAPEVFACPPIRTGSAVALAPTVPSGHHSEVVARERMPVLAVRLRCVLGWERHQPQFANTDGRLVPNGGERFVRLVPRKEDV